MDVFSNIIVILTIASGLSVPLGLLLLITSSIIRSQKLYKFGMRLLLFAGIILLSSFALCSLGIVKV